MDILALLERLEELVQNATRVPLTGRVMIDPDEVLALVDEMREALPEEIRAAGRVAEAQESILEAARAEAESLVRDAKAYAAQLTDESAVTREAQSKADEIIEQAKRVAKEIRNSSMDYADNLLARVEENLHKAQETVRRGREELHG